MQKSKKTPHARSVNGHAAKEAETLGELNGGNSQREVVAVIFLLVLGRNFDVVGA